MSIERKDSLEDINNNLDSIRIGVGQIYANMNNESYIDEQIFGVTVDDVHKYIGNLGKVEFGQDLIYGQVSVSSLPIEDEQTYKELCYYSEVYKPSKFDPEIINRVHFVKIRKKDREFVMTVIPIQLEDGNINIRIEKLNRKEAKIMREIYKRTGKLRMEDIEFKKFT